MNIVSVQAAFDKEIPDHIRGNSEYLTELQILQNINRLLQESGAEKIVMQNWLEKAAAERAPQKLSHKAKVAIQENAVFALRAAILRRYRNLSYRDFACELARAPLDQWFCHINRWSEVRIPGKSKIQANEQALPETLLRQIEKNLLHHAFAESGKDGTLGTEEKIAPTECFFDTFCLKTNIHYPVDWVLLRDASRTLMLAVTQIRKHGILNRMTEECQRFVSQMNRLCIKMTHTSRRKGSKKIRKQCFREMKKLIKKIEKHARVHLHKLNQQWAETTLSEGQMRQIVKRIENVLAKLPVAIRQGHERIIGERRVKNEDKILSLYEDGVNVIVRRKAGAEVEFGNKVSLLEQSQGLILDWDLAAEGSPSDVRLCRESYDRTREGFGSLGSLTTDRGCTSRQNSEHLKENATYDAMCPRRVSELQLRMKESEFRALQKRRGSTEARISILQKFTGVKLKCKGFGHRRQQFGLSVLTHNLWLLSRLLIAGRVAREEQARETVPKQTG